MKFLIDNWMLIAVAFASGAMLLWPVVQGGVGAGLNTMAAVQLINRQKALVIDVCEPAEFAAGHVAGARNVPLGELSSRLGDVARDKSQPLLMVCSGGPRAGRAAAAARKLGYAEVKVLAGGLRAWKEANLPVEKS